MSTKHEEVNVEVAQPDASVELGRVGKVRAAVEKVATPEAATMVARLTALLVAWQAADTALGKARDARAARHRAATVVRMMLQVIDGIRCTIGFLDPPFSASLPLRSKLETEDPFGFARQFVTALEDGNARAKAHAEDLTAVIKLANHEQSKVTDGDSQFEQLDKNVTLARLKVREYEKACEQFIHTHLPKNDPAVKNLQPKKKPRAKKSETKPQPSSTKPATPPAANEPTDTNQTGSAPKVA